MIWLILAVLAVLAWDWRRRRLGDVRFGDAAALAVLVVAAGLIRRGESVPALLLAAGSGVYAWRRLRRARSTRPRRPVSDETADARALLELPPDADPSAIRAAHRRLIARVHPDAGGNAEVARRVNRARDILLAERRRA